jgi:hypothetical protein
MISDPAFEANFEVVVDILFLPHSLFYLNPFGNRGAVSKNNKIIDQTDSIIISTQKKPSP